MITSSSIPYISQVFNEPQNISANDAESIKALILAYPYFVPARYMEAAKKHQKTPFGRPMMAEMQLYMGNWLLYNQFLNAAAGNARPVQEAEPPVKTRTAPVSEAVQPSPSDEGFIRSQEEMPVTEEIALADEEESLIDAAEGDPFIEPVTQTILAEQIPQEEYVATSTQDPVEETFVTLEREAPKKEPLYKDFTTPGSLTPETDESFILPVYTEDYFLHQGMHVSNAIPTDMGRKEQESEEAKQLMVVMSFSEWLSYFKNRKEKETEDAQDRKAVKTMWQKEKLAAALEEENEEIPEKVFEMAVNSIAKEDDLASESLAEIHTKQGRYDKAIEMYRKLSLRNPQKKAYFARKIEIILKEKES